jgi:hypothetical protein
MTGRDRCLSAIALAPLTDCLAHFGRRRILAIPSVHGAERETRPIARLRFSPVREDPPLPNLPKKFFSRQGYGGQAARPPKNAWYYRSAYD